MADWIVIGKRSFNRTDRPHVIYCGQSREEAAAAVNAAAGNFVYFYYLDPQPYALVRPTSVGATAEASAHAETEEKPKKRRKAEPAEAAA